MLPAALTRVRPDSGKVRAARPNFRVESAKFG